MILALAMAAALGQMAARDEVRETVAPASPAEKVALPPLAPPPTAKVMAPLGYVPTNSFPRAPIMRDYKWNRVTADDFPEMALKERREGVARAVVMVDKAGQVTSCKIEASSGHADLDAKTCILLKARAAFDPALNINGQPSPGRISTGIHWMLPPPKTEVMAVPAIPKPVYEQSLPKPNKRDLTIRIDETGTVRGCDLGPGSTYIDQDKPLCSQILNAASRFKPWVDASGKPVAARLIIRSSVDIVPEPGK